MESERGSLAVEAIDASANIESAGLSTEPSDANGARAADGCTNDSMNDDGVTVTAMALRPWTMKAWAMDSGSR